MSTQLCPLCKIRLTDYKHIPDNDEYWHDCRNCGEYSLSGSLMSSLGSITESSPTNAPIISHYIRKAQDQNKRPSLTTYLVEDILADGSIPTPHEQADNLILWLGTHLGIPGETITLDSASHQAMMGAASISGADQVLNFLYDNGLLDGLKSEASGRCIHIAESTLSFSGWEQFHELRQGAVDSRKAFMAMQFKDPDLDKIYKEHFKPAVALTGFDLQTVLDQPKAGLIDDRIKVEILTSRFLIADLTHDNLGAYWEAGYADGLGKPVIYTCEKTAWDNKKTHFDTNHYHTVIWEKDKPEEAADSLKATIRATLRGEAKMTDE